MHEKYFFITVIFLMMVASPAAGSLTKITAGSPVFIGEQNLDISSGLQGCRVIDWWAPGADTNAPPQKNVTIIKTLDDSNIAFGYTISPDTYNAYEGPWYCEGQKPLRVVFNVTRPRLMIRFWDIDSDQDVSGKVIPRNANITFHIDTNLDAALQLKNRPGVTQLDTFYTISLADPSNQSLLSVYTGTYGRTGTVGLLFDKSPMITSSPYIWKDGASWDRTSRNIQGDDIYPPGTYTVTVSQNLNRMAQLYSGLSGDDTNGLLTSTASVTFVKEGSTVTTPQTVPVATISTVPATPSQTMYPSGTPSPTTLPLPGRTTVPLKTTYAPLQVWIVLAALGITLARVPRR